MPHLLKNLPKYRKADFPRPENTMLFFFGDEKWNVGSRLKHVFLKFGGLRPMFKGVNTRSKFCKTSFRGESRNRNVTIMNGYQMIPASTPNIKRRIQWDSNTIHPRTRALNSIVYPAIRKRPPTRKLENEPAPKWIFKGKWSENLFFEAIKSVPERGGASRDDAGRRKRKGF